MTVLKDGTVAVVGRPNAGKSTLVNALVGHKIGIVSPRPQTTRHDLRGVVRGEGCRIVFVDTPGTHRPLHQMNRGMMEAVRGSLAGCDAVCLVVEATDRGGGGIEFLFDLVGTATAPRILVPSKIDMVQKNRLLPMIASYTSKKSFDAVVPVSAKTGDGLPILLEEIVKFLPEVRSIPAEDPPEATADFRIAELIREALLLRCGEEIPYTTAVRIDGIRPPEKEGAVHRVVATIVVDRNGQKKIVVGSGGKMIKDIGTEARQGIEALLGNRVFLDLQVIVEEGWREDQRFLSELPSPEKKSEIFSGDDDDDDEGGPGDSDDMD